MLTNTRMLLRPCRLRCPLAQRDLHLLHACRSRRRGSLHRRQPPDDNVSDKQQNGCHRTRRRHYHLPPDDALREQRREEKPFSIGQCATNPLAPLGARYKLHGRGLHSNARTLAFCVGRCVMPAGLSRAGHRAKNNDRCPSLLLKKTS